MFNQAQQLSQQLVKAQADASTLQAAAVASRQQAASLALQLEAAQSEVQALRRLSAAATQEAAGFAQWCLSKPSGSSLQGVVGAVAHDSDMVANSTWLACTGHSQSGPQSSVAEALRCRDEGLIKWFEARVVGVLKHGQLPAGRQQPNEQQASDSDRVIALVREVRASPTLWIYVL